jgi:APA family basic amino acid/polyamine antiporter
MTNEKNTPVIKQTLGLLGASMNAMALIAPGAFLWITYQLQAAATAPGGIPVSSDIWLGIVVALGVAFLTAISYSQLAKIYPKAGFASVTYFAEKAFIDNEGGKKRPTPTSIARVSKLVTGWAAHLFYWVYPGVMVAFMAMLIGYIYNQFTGNTLAVPVLVIIGTAFAFIIGFIAYRGITGSTMTSIWINIIQWVALVLFSGLAIWYRIANPQGANAWAFTNGWDIIRPHSLNGVLVQSTLAILILVGFESCTALAAETKQPEKNIPKAIIISLVVQGLVAYLIQYFAAGAMIGNKLSAVVSDETVTGMAAAAASGAPIGDLTKLIGDSIVPGLGFGLMITMSITVAIAIIGTTLSCMNTAVRVSAGMAEDREVPEFLSFLSRKFSTPHTAIWALVVVSCVIAAIGVQSVTGLTGITLASNFGTFVLYGLTCIWTIIAYKNRKDFNIVKHAVIPGLGIVVNLVMLGAIIFLYTTGNADSVAEAKICFYIAGAWGLLSFAYVVFTSVRKTYGLKLISAMIRPEMLDILVEVLKDEELLQGMTVTKIKGIGRQQGHTVEKDAEPINERISFIPKLRVEILVNDWDVTPVLDVMRDVLNTGKLGDGKIFVMDAKGAMRVRTGEKGVYAV